MKCVETLQSTKKQTSAPDTEPKEENQEATISTEQPTTGVSHLNWLLIENSTLETKAAIYTCLHICRQNPKLAGDIEAMIFNDLKPFIEGKRDDPKMDTECDIMPAIEWLSILCGFEAARLK